MKTISLSQGLHAAVDDADFDWLSQWKWTAERQDKSTYAMRTARDAAGKYRNVYMHRELTGAPTSHEVDHRNGNGLDNQRGNLRVCTRLQNARNTGHRCHNTSGFKGVSKAKRGWVTQVSGRNEVGELRRVRSHHPTKIAAAIEYNIQAIRHYGEFARLNDVFSGEVPL